MVIIFHPQWCGLLSQEKWKGCFGGGRWLLWWDFVWRGVCMESFFALFPLSSWWPWGFLSACLILKETPEVQIGVFLAGGWEPQFYMRVTYVFWVCGIVWACSYLRYRVGRMLWKCSHVTSDIQDPSNSPSVTTQLSGTAVFSFKALKKEKSLALT